MCSQAVVQPALKQWQEAGTFRQLCCCAYPGVCSRLSELPAGGDFSSPAVSLTTEEVEMTT